MGKNNEENITQIGNNEDVPYHSLSPKSDKDNHKNYCDALDWALKHRKEKDIKNIAITGPYGSGKSSILKTFKETTKNKTLKFLDISLATFKEEDFKYQFESDESDANNDKNGNVQNVASGENKGGELNHDNKNNQLRLIELSILQQILYREKYTNIPDSRFKKIRSLDGKEIEKATWLLFGVICSFYAFFFHEDLQNLLRVDYLFNWQEYLSKSLVLMVFLILFYLLLKKVIVFLQKITISKLNFQNLEIQVKEDVEKSILNYHLDEILYFFEATDYNVVIIEDLDRFEQTEIFTKLREINLLINNSESIQQDVTFIYAVRDEMFKDNDRTKFFDFIIPIIPIINYSNSNEQLTRALANFNYVVSTELIDNVAFFIDDMRLLYNIVNEFHIYFKKFKEPKFKDKLFAIIVYKNIHPEDFTSLSKNEGVLYNYLVNERAIWIKGIIDGLDKEIAKLKKEYEILESTYPNNLDELKRIYLFEYLNKKPQLVKFRQGSSNYSLSEMMKDENFEMLINNKLSWVDIYGSPQGLGFTFNQVEKEIDPSIGYNERRELLEKTNSGKLGAIQKEIAALEVTKSETRSKKIKDLIQNKHIKPPQLPDKQTQLILIMLRNGYIEEDYLHYISYFYPGSISERDHWFLMNVRNELNTELDYKLDKCGNIIKRISISDFRKPYALNFGLVDFILGQGKTSLPKKEALFNQLCNESKTSVTFVKGYIESGKHPDKFVKELCSKWPSIWTFIASSSEFNNEEVSRILLLILNHAEIDHIKKFSSRSKFFLEVTHNTNSLSSFSKEDRLKEVVEAFELKFSEINFKGVPKEVKEFIYTQNHYAINTSMIKLMMESFGTFDLEKFETGNYTAIQDSKCPNLIAYIENNITDYVKDVYLKLESNTQESEEGLLKLINNPKIPTYLKEDIVAHSTTKVDSFSKLDEPSELMNFLLDTSNIQANWAIVIDVFEKNEATFPEPLNQFLNYEENCDQLSRETLIGKTDGYKEFRIAFLLNDKIEDTLYQNYLNAFPYTYKDLNFESLSKRKVQSLVEQQKIAFTPTNYNKLKSKFPDLHLHLSVNNMTDFFENYAAIANVILEEDLIGFLENQKLSDSNKIKLLERYDIDNHIIEPMSLTLIGNLLLKHPVLKLSTENLKSVLLRSNLSQVQRIELYLRQPTLFDNEFISNFLNILGGEFPKLNKKGPMPSFENRPVLISFFQYLKKIGKISKVKSNGEGIMVTTFRN